MASQVTQDQAHMLLRLYELRREPRLRQAREWFLREFYPKSLADRIALTPEQDTHVRMVTSYWDMAANFVRRGLVDEEMFLENTAELWLVWDRLRPIANETREDSRDPQIWENLERLAIRYENWRERRAPGSLAALRERIEKARAAAKR